VEHRKGSSLEWGSEGQSDLVHPGGEPIKVILMYEKFDGEGAK
jgi:hypothetical protein